MSYKYSGNNVKFMQFYQQAVETCSMNSTFFLLSLIKQPQENAEEVDATVPGNCPLIIWTISQISWWTIRYQKLSELKDKIRDILSEKSICNFLTTIKFQSLFTMLMKLAMKWIQNSARSVLFGFLQEK